MKYYNDLIKHPELKSFTEDFAQMHESDHVKIPDDEFQALVAFLKEALPILKARCEQPDTVLHLGRCLDALLSRHLRQDRDASNVFAEVYAEQGWSIERLRNLIEKSDEDLKSLIKIFVEAIGFRTYDYTHTINGTKFKSFMTDDFWRTCMNLSPAEHEYLTGKERAINQFYHIKKEVTWDLQDGKVSDDDMCGAYIILTRALEDFHFARTFESEVEAKLADSEILPSDIREQFKRYEAIRNRNRSINLKLADKKIEVLVRGVCVDAISQGVRYSDFSQSEVDKAVIGYVIQSNDIRYLMASKNKILLGDVCRKIYKQDAIDAFKSIVAQDAVPSDTIDIILNDCVDDSDHAKREKANRFLQVIIDAKQPKLTQTLTRSLLFRSGQDQFLGLLKILCRTEGAISPLVNDYGKTIPTLLCALRISRNHIPMLLRAGLSMDFEYEAKSLWGHLAENNDIRGNHVDSAIFSNDPLKLSAFKAELPIYNQALIETYKFFVERAGKNRSHDTLLAYSSADTSNKAPAFVKVLKDNFIRLRNEAAERDPETHPNVTYTWLSRYDRVVEWPDPDKKMYCDTMATRSEILKFADEFKGRRVKVHLYGQGNERGATVCGTLEYIKPYQDTYDVCVDGKIYGVELPGSTMRFITIVPEERVEAVSKPKL